MSKPFQIAFVPKNEGNPAFDAARAGAEAAARTLSARHGLAIEVRWLPPSRLSAELQAQRIDEAVAAGASAVAVSCGGAEALEPAIEEAVARGVPVMTFDADAPGSRRFAHYGPDDQALGRAVMRDLAAITSGAVAILAGHPDGPNLRQRVKGALAEAERHANVELIGTFHHAEIPADASALVRKVQRAYPQLRGWAMLGGWALASEDAAAALDPQRTKIVATSALPMRLSLVEQGLAPVLWALPARLWGSVVVETCVEQVHFRRPVPAAIRMEPLRLDAARLREPRWRRLVEGA